MDLLNQILAFVTNHLLGSTATVALVLEFVLRMFPTQKPVSLLWIVHDFVAVIGKILGSVAEFLDKILPQRTV